MEIKLRKRLIYAGDLWHKTFDCEEPGDFRKAIENAPSVDAVEVVHGRWVGREEKLWNLDMPVVTMWECSVCKMSGGYYEYNYCPNCGAKMDGDGNA